MQYPLSIRTVVCMVSPVRMKLVDDNGVVSIVHTRKIGPLRAAMTATATTSEASMEAAQQLDSAMSLPPIKRPGAAKCTVNHVARQEIHSTENERELTVSGGNMGFVILSSRVSEDRGPEFLVQLPDTSHTWTSGGTSP